MSRDHVRTVFPEVAEIDDEALGENVVEAWATAKAENDIDDLRTLPWFPPAMRDLGIEDESLVDHVRDVTAGAVGLAETLVERRGTPIDLDTVIAGALLHDVSKCYEFDGMQETPMGELLGHPYYGVHVVAAADLPVELGHVVLSHTERTAVEPATLEAVVVRRADEAAAAAIRAEASGGRLDG
jgi:putative nucleotidyltransferase with HDIG domain